MTASITMIIHGEREATHRLTSRQEVSKFLTINRQGTQRQGTSEASGLEMRRQTERSAKNGHEDAESEGTARVRRVAARKELATVRLANSSSNQTGSVPHSVDTHLSRTYLMARAKLCWRVELKGNGLRARKEIADENFNWPTAFHVYRGGYRS